MIELTCLTAVRMSSSPASLNVILELSFQARNSVELILPGVFPNLPLLIGTWSSMQNRNDLSGHGGVVELPKKSPGYG